MKKISIDIPADVPSSMHKTYEQNYLKVLGEYEKLFLFAGDQKIEHLNSDFYGPGIDKADSSPEHLFKIASQGKVGVMATQLGLISMYGNDYKDINYVVKLNSKTNLVSTAQKDPVSLSLNSVNDVVSFAKTSKLKIVGVGYTIYLGSEFEAVMLQEASHIVFQAHQNGLLAMLWIYPRGKAVKNEKSLEMIAGAVGVAACLGADFVKVNPPEAENSKKSAESLKIATLAAGKTKVICSGGKQKVKKTFLKEVEDLIKIGGAQGIAVGRNLHQRSLKEAVSLINDIYKIFKK
ncbi:MAG: aldolase [bacterium]